MKKKRIFWGLSELLIFITYLFSLQNVFLILFFSIPLLSFFTFRMSVSLEKKLEIEIKMKRMLRKETDSLGSLILKNKAHFGVMNYQILLRMKNHLTLEEEEIRLDGRMEAGEIKKLDYMFTPHHCGGYSIEISECKLLDIFGIFARKKRRMEMEKCYVFPDLLLEEFVLEDSFVSDYEAEEYDEWKKGNSPGEMVEIREYERGDSLKQIHWKLSGKLQKLMISEPGLLIENREILMFDNIFLNEKEEEIREKLDLAVQKVCSIGGQLLEEGKKYRIAWMDTNTKEACCYVVEEEEMQMEVLKKLLFSGWKKSGKKIWEHVLPMEGEVIVRI